MSTKEFSISTPLFLQRLLDEMKSDIVVIEDATFSVLNLMSLTT